MLPADLPGFDLPEALARLNGNRRLHAELLLQFVAEHSDCTVSIARARAAARPAEAAATLHRLKGAATVVGARDVADAAAAAEQAILHGRPASLDPLHDALMAAVAAVCAEVSTDDRTRADGEAGVDTTLADLAHALRTGDAAALEHARRLKCAAPPDWPQEVLRELELQVERFDFLRAALTLDRLVEWRRRGSARRAARAP